MNAENVVPFLHEQGRLTSDVTATAELLAWGVSNVVLRISSPPGEEFVLKQSREQLRTEVLWKSNLDRIYRECEVMQALTELLPGDTVPKILFEDRRNYLFAMQAVPAEHVVWKADLLNGIVDLEIARRAGEILAAIHSQTAGNIDFRSRWQNTEVFEQLRVDPFYRFVSEKHPRLKKHINQLIQEMWQNKLCVTHADFSPKNILISELGVTLVDYETAHYGDPAFDIGFFLSHLLLKTILYSQRAAEYLQLSEVFWNTYITSFQEVASEPDWNRENLEARSMLHLAACMLSRVDGTSTIDYLTEDAQIEMVRKFCYEMFETPLNKLGEALMHIQRKIQE